jgi:cAMP-binding proteins - catabolite gene activator and regulatory subunit of cAMP-dependent protein kinases
VSERAIDELLAETEVFKGLNGDQLELVAGCGKLVALEPGQELFEEGDEADTFYLLRHGRVALGLMMPGAGTMTISTHGPGEMIGWSWLFPPYRWHFDGRVVERGSAIVFDGECLRGKAEADHDLGYELMKRFAGQMIERLQATRIQVLDVYGHPAPS